MGLKKISRFENSAEGYFDNLPEGTREIVKEMLVDTFEKHCETYTGPQHEEVECHSRDGFIAFSHNRGGIMVRGFTDINSINGSGTFPAHEGARKEIERQIDYSYQACAEHVFKKFKEGLEARKLTVKDCYYHDLYELEKKNPDDEFYREVRSYLEDSETEFLSGDCNSVMYEVRFMYHGKLDGKHRASVSCAVNTEGPYHRSSISWAPNVFCEGSKEVEIVFSNQKDLKDRLQKALYKTAKEVL